MFNKLKQFKELRDQAKTIQNVLAQEKIEIERNGIKLVMDGNQKVVEFKINSETSIETVEKELPGMFNDAIGKIQRIMATKMQEMGGLGNLGNFGQ